MFSVFARGTCVCARACGLSARGSRELALSRGSRVRSRCVDAWGMKARAVWVWHRLRLLLLRGARAGGGFGIRFECARARVPELATNVERLA